MKIKTIFLPIISLIFLIPTERAAGDTRETWFPFVLSEKMDRNSVANAGALTLDAPAGKHGFLGVVGGRFLFRDGTPMKFWGTNLCFSANFPSKQQAEFMADRLAFFGFNAVRLHHMDHFDEPEGIFEAPGPPSPAAGAGHAKKLSEKQLEKLDYLIYALKQKGIYVDVNLLVTRHYEESEGVVDAKALGAGARAVSFFDPRIIDLQKNYARSLLTHFNKYTMLKYSEDPAIALVEITNENSLIQYWQRNQLNGSIFGLKKDSIPDHYAKELDGLWNAWLRKKYGSVAAVKKAWRSEGSVSDAQKDRSDFDFTRPLYKFIVLSPPVLRKDIEDFYLDLERAYFDEMRDYLIKDLQVAVPITGIGGYRVQEDIVAQSSCDFIDKHAYWAHPQFPKKTWDRNNFKIEGGSMLADKRLGIIGEIVEDGVSDKPFTITEWHHCYPDPYAYETPVLIACKSMEYGWAGLFQFAFKHYAPALTSLDSIEQYFDTLANPQQLLLDSAASRIMAGDPTEVHASVVDGILRVTSPYVEGFVGNIGNKTLAGDRLSVSSMDDGAVLVCATDRRPIEESTRLLVLTVSSVKNSGSYWDGAGIFHWGRAPVLMKKVTARIQLRARGTLRVYPLDGSGVREQKIDASSADGNLTFSTLSTNSPWFELSEN